MLALVALLFKMALLLGTQAGGRRRSLGWLGSWVTGVAAVPEPERPRRRRSNRDLTHDVDSPNGPPWRLAASLGPCW